MRKKQTVKELIDYYRDVARKGLEEVPIQKLTVEGCEIINTNEKEIDNSDGLEITYTCYVCNYEGYRYEFGAYANQDLLEFVQSLVSPATGVDFKELYYRKKIS